MGLTRVLGGIVFFALLHNLVQGQSVTLAWDPNPEPDIAGYLIYSRELGGTYTPALAVTSGTTGTITGLRLGTIYFFVATAFNTSGLESDFSNEVTCTLPGAPVKLQIRVAAAGQVVLTVTGEIGHSYNLLVSQGFTAWTVLGTVTLGTSGSVEFVDANAVNLKTRFYRMQEKP